MADRSQAKREEWSEVLKRREESGLSVARYCRENGIPQWKYHYWRRRLRREATDGNGFVEVSFSGPPGGSGLWFELRSGLRLVIARGFDVEELLRVLEAVGSGGC